MPSFDPAAASRGLFPVASFDVVGFGLPEATLLKPTLVAVDGLPLPERGKPGLPEATRVLGLPVARVLIAVGR